MFEKIITGVTTATYTVFVGVTTCYLISQMAHDKERRAQAAKALELREREVAVEEAKLAAKESPAE